MSKRPTYFHLWKRSASEDAILRIFECLLQEIPCKIVRTSLRWAWKANAIHTFPNWSESLYDRIGLHGFQLYRQIVALRAKSDDVKIEGADRSRAAWESYCKSEVLGKEVNWRMRNESQFLADIGPEAAEDFLRAVELVAEVLGPVPSYSELPMRFGPGANVSCRQKTSARYKLSAPLGVSQEGLKDVPILRDLFPRFFDGREVVVESAVMVEVPKNALTNRTVELQPSLCTFVQLGIGSVMKTRLLKRGINLYDQSLNQRRARRASVSNDDATVDAESASDSIMVKAVELLLRRATGWFDLLSTWRCGRTHANGFDFNSQKFSAMGNGYTFELESLLFWALARGVCDNMGIKGRVSIYGDDLICPSVAYDRIVRLYAHVGFRVNNSKSYKDGRFRESCGADYVLGYNVRPFYIKSRLTTARLVGFRNFISNNALSEACCAVIDSILAERQETIFYGPPGLGDGHVVTDDRTLWSAVAVRRDGFSGMKVRTYTQTPIRDKRPLGALPGDHLLPTYLLDIRDRANYVRGVYIGDLRTHYDHDSGSAIKLAHDPYVLRGAGKAKVTRLYVLT